MSFLTTKSGKQRKRLEDDSARAVSVISRMSLFGSGKIPW